MRTITKEQAASDFAAMMKEVIAGEEVVITDDGVAVARIIPLQRPLAGAERDRAIERMMESLDKCRLNLGGRRFSRDEMHER